MLPYAKSQRASQSRALSAAGLLSVARTAIGVWRQRRSLARLDAGLLDDVGLTRAEAETEAGRPIWDVPANWRA